MRPETVRANRLLDSRQPSFTEVPMRQTWLAVVVALSLPFAPLATGAQPPRSADSRPFKPEELEQIVAPIVQYPDPLLAQIFMASTYPLEVIQAARFAKDHPSLKGDALNTYVRFMVEHPYYTFVNPLPYFPGPAGVLQSLIDDRAYLLDSAWNSLQLLLAGYALGVAVAFASGFFASASLAFSFSRFCSALPTSSLFGPSGFSVSFDNVTRYTRSMSR